MPTELPRYLVRYPSYLEGVGTIARVEPEEISLPVSVPVRNSWEPKNEAARQQFRLRNEKSIAESLSKIDELQKSINEAKEDGAVDDELAGLNEELSALRVAHAKLPRQLKAVPGFGAKPTHVLEPVSGKRRPPLEEKKADPVDQVDQVDKGVPEPVTARRATMAEHQVELAVASAISQGAGATAVKEIRDSAPKPKVVGPAKRLSETD
jgi:hypothetical protein